MKALGYAKIFTREQAREGVSLEAQEDKVKSIIYRGENSKPKVC